MLNYTGTYFVDFNFEVMNFLTIDILQKRTLDMLCTLKQRKSHQKIYQHRQLMQKIKRQ